MIDRRRRSFWRENAYRDVWLVILSVVLLLVAVRVSDQSDKTARQVREQRAEAAERRDQTCLLFERSFRDDVNQLQARYDYLLGLTPRQRRTGLNRVIFAQLPTSRAHAVASRPPPYCAPTRVGLDEPFPEVPKRPKALSE